jgi:hypothetical protein
MSEYRCERHKVNSGLCRSRGERVPEIVLAKISHAQTFERTGRWALPWLTAIDIFQVS